MKKECPSEKSGTCTDQAYRKISGHGGYRPGAGSKKKTPLGAKRHTFLLTDTEHSKVKEYIKQLRATK